VGDERGLRDSRDYVVSYSCLEWCSTVYEKGGLSQEGGEEERERESEPESCTVISNLDYICYFILHQDCSDWETLEKWKGEEEMYEFCEMKKDTSFDFQSAD